MHSGILAPFLSIYSLQIYSLKQPEHIFSGLQQGYIELLASMVEMPHWKIFIQSPRRR